MELLYAVLREDRLLWAGDGEMRSFLSSGKEVDASYGFDSPEEENQAVSDWCGLCVYRKYVYFTAAYCVAVFEAQGNLKLYDGFSWRSADELKDVVPEKQAAFRLALNGRKSKTAPWMEDGGLARYLDWAKKELTHRGILVSGTIRQIKNAYVSTIFYIPTDNGGVYLKIASSVYVNSAEKERMITERMGGVPAFIAVSEDGFAGITWEMPGEDGRTVDIAGYKRCVEEWGKRQATAQTENEYGLMDFSLEKLLRDLPFFAQKIEKMMELAGKGMDAEQRIQLEKKAEKIQGDLSRLASYSLPSTLCHGDIRPGNMRIMEGNEILYDWGMSFYGHPFYDVVHFLHVIRRQITQEQKKELLDAYLDEWRKEFGGVQLEEAYGLAEGCRDYFMLMADFLWVEKIVKGCGGLPLQGTMDDWLFTRRFYYFERVLNRFLAG